MKTQGKYSPASAIEGRDLLEESKVSQRERFILTHCILRVLAPKELKGTLHSDS